MDIGVGMRMGMGMALKIAFGGVANLSRQTALMEEDLNTLGREAWLVRGRYSSLIIFFPFFFSL